MSVLWEIFQNMKLWNNDEEDINQCLVWIECNSIHLSVWSKENTRKIKEIWGVVLCLDMETEKGEFLCSAKMMVLTKKMNLINHGILL